MDCVPDGDERLERHHRFIVFAEVAANHQDLLAMSHSFGNWTNRSSSLARSHRAWVVTRHHIASVLRWVSHNLQHGVPAAVVAVDPVPHRVFR